MENNQLMIFNSVEFGQVRTMMIDGEPWFMLNDLCRVLEIVNSSRAKTRLSSYGVHSMKVIDSMGRTQQATFVNESNLYKLIFQSRKPQAEKFSDWVTGEVLPNIRKNGMYAIEQPKQLPTDYLSALKMLVASEEEKLRLKQEKENLIHSPKTYTSTEIAKELGFSSARKFNQVLHEKGLIYKQSGVWMLYSQYSDLGYQSIKQSIINEGLENEKIIYSSKWTGEGRDWLINTIFNKGGM